MRLTARGERHEGDAESEQTERARW
jgi:hypothetical protein